MYALGPPVEASGRAHETGLLLEGDAASELRIFELLDGGEMLVDEARVGQRPEMLGGLQLGGVGREKEQVHVVGHAQAHTGMPARTVEDEHDLLARTGPRRARKLRQLHFKEGNADGGGQMEEGATGGGMHEADQIAPCEAMLHRRGGPLANRGPDPAQERFQADAMFVGGPQLHLRVGKGGRHCLQQRP